MKYCDKVDIDDIFGEKKPALYAWTADDYANTPKSTKYKIKIGMSTSVCQRVYNYHTAHPDGVWILDLMRVRTSATKKDLLNLEKQLQHELKPYFYQAPSRAPNKGEWYVCTERQMNDAFKNVCVNNPYLCVEVMQPAPLQNNNNSILNSSKKEPNLRKKGGVIVHAGMPPVKKKRKTKKLNDL